LYVSDDNGASWKRFSHLGSGDDYVLDNMEVDPVSGTMYVAAWSIEQEGGDLFRSRDGGRTWQTAPDLHGKSIRAMTLAPSDPNTIVVGALDGVFRSQDGGSTWQRISPLNHAEIKNIESVAIDPRNPDVIYAGTWHLPWKTTDGGRTWHSIKQGVIDDSDVFSIIVDQKNPQAVYLSACSGIYKSDNAAELFHKVQGIPFSARRTRVLKQDPVDSAMVYAGTTEGLWRTSDSGRTWQRISAANIIVNDVHIDPRDPRRVLVATDRSGVLASVDGGRTFVASNRGFTHRKVASVLADRDDSQTIYAGLVNDKEFGGLFVSRDGGQLWRQLNDGLRQLDVFTLAQTEKGGLVAGTNHGIFELPRGTEQWHPISLVVREKVIPAPRTTARTKSKTPAPPKIELVKSELDARVSQFALTPKRWFAASSKGLYISLDEGKTWRGGPVLGNSDFIGLQADGDRVLAITRSSLVISEDGGNTWKSAQLPAYLTGVFSLAIAPEHVVWLATREGAFRTSDWGATWEHVLGGLPPRQVYNVAWDAQGKRLLAIAGRGALYSSADAGQNWTEIDAGFRVISWTANRGRLFAATAFDGVVVQPEESRVQRSAVGGNRNSR
jgi:photosystem II stability/assembly factor-like uncharacterized protein